MSMPNWRKLEVGWVRGPKILVFGLSLLPLAGLIRAAATEALGANPIETITRTTGWWTLVFLTIGLAVTPVRKLFGWMWLGRFRRMLGLFGFFYGALHLLTYLVLDQFFAWTDILTDIAKRPYITVGFAAFVMMVPLATTSTDSMIRRLGGKNWKRLHQLVYLIGTAGVVHFWWLVKKDIREPALFALILMILLLSRLNGLIGSDASRRFRQPRFRALRENGRPDELA